MSNELNDLVLHVDATPNIEYPLRILRAYRNNADLRLSNSTNPDIITEQTPFVKVMNEAQCKRAEILDKAIKILEELL